ncbi:hypothetical protein E2562_005624, partial [Oryza meyeriana var. granulata]
GQSDQLLLTLELEDELMSNNWTYLLTVVGWLVPGWWLLICPLAPFYRKTAYITVPEQPTTATASSSRGTEQVDSSD